MYGCEAWSLPLQQQKSKGSENKVLRKIFGPKQEDEVCGRHIMSYMSHPFSVVVKQG
jgi:hypothetical protein